MNETPHPILLALSAVIADAASLLRVPAAEITVEYVEAKEWPDSCLGLPQGNEGCADVITPGYLVVLTDGFSYRADMLGNVRRETDNQDQELEVHFRQVGGIGGWSSEYHADDGSLSPDDAAQIRQFIDSTDFFRLPKEVGNGAPISTCTAIPSRWHTGAATTRYIPMMGLDHTRVPLWLSSSVG